VTLPRNAVSAVVEIQASGNNEEEFWYYNLPNEYLPYANDATFGDSSFREVRVLVDGQIAGVVFPYPVIFTGAFLPTVSIFFALFRKNCLKSARSGRPSSRMVHTIHRRTRWISRLLFLSLLMETLTPSLWMSFRMKVTTASIPIGI
jgi:Peptide N-acetyl-beta-D-glucosaminyl asparaginase amidase A